MVLDGNGLNASLILFGCSLARFCQARLSALFIGQENGSPASMDPGSRVTRQYVNTTTTDIFSRTDTAHQQEYFRSVCAREAVSHKIWHNGNHSIELAIAKSRYADLMLINPWLTLDGEASHIPSSLVRNLLTKSECPVMIASEPPFEISQLVFCHDETPSSAYAIKQFTYLFPEFRNRKATLFAVKAEEDPENHQDPDMVEWVKSNYANTHVKSVYGNREEQLMKYLLTRKKSIVVMGAYGRSLLSMYFRHSAADQMLQFLELPFFIAHH